MAVDDVNRGGLQGACRAEDVGQEGPPCERLQHFRQGRMHTLALPGGKNDYGNRRQTEDLEDRWTLMIPRPPAEPLRYVSRGRRAPPAAPRGEARAPAHFGC